MGYFLIGIIGLLFFTVWIIKYLHKNKIKRSQLIGIDYIVQLKALIYLVQQHRGLSICLLNHDDSSQSKLMTTQADIVNLLNKIEAFELSFNQRWISFIDHWDRMLTLKNELSFSDSFDQHCLLIKNLSLLLEDTSENYLLTGEFCTKFPNISYTWRELILATENIAQARAIGTNVCMQEYCSNVDKIKLHLLIDNIKKITANTLYKLHYINADVDKHDDNMNAATLKIEILTDIIFTELIDTENITLNHQQYFSMATLTLKAFDEIFYHQIEQIKKIIH